MSSLLIIEDLNPLTDLIDPTLVVLFDLIALATGHAEN